MEPSVSLPEALRRERGATVCIDDGGGVALTGAELAERVAALAARLRKSGCRTLAVHLDNGPDWIVADFAGQAAGVCLVPLPTFFSAAQLRHVFASMPIDAVLTTRPDDIPAPRAARTVAGPGAARLLRLEPVDGAGALPPGTGKVTFTSGSTGRPKGVCLGHTQLLAQARALLAAAGLERPRHLCVLPLSTLLENVAGVYAPLLGGGEVIAPPLSAVGLTGSSSLDPQRFVAMIAQQAPNSLILTPQLLQTLVAAARAGWTPPGTLQFVAVGGARVPAGLIEAAHALGIPAYEGYGLSECASVVSLNRPAAARPGSCGKPLPHLRVTVVNGEIRVSGNAMLGYVGDTRSWGRETIATGDLGALDADGFLHIEGRRRNVLISSYGRNVSPEWVESELLADDRLAECVVLGDARPWCVALIRPRTAELPDAAIQAAVDRCNRGLPDYACIRGWARLPEPIASRPALVTANGRPKREAIQAHYRTLIDGLYAGAAIAEPPEVKIA